MNRIVSRNTTPADDVRTLIENWQKLAAPVRNRKVGYIQGDILGRGAPDVGIPMGDLIRRAAGGDRGGGQGRGADRVHEPGRDPLGLPVHAGERRGRRRGHLRRGVHRVQPFTNMMVTQTLTGQAVLDVLAQQVSGSNEASPRYLQISKGLTYTVDLKQTGAARIVAGSVKLNGEPVDPAKNVPGVRERVLAAGGDRFPAFKTGTAKLNGVSDLDALTAYLAGALSPDAPLAVPAADRITFLR
ncbi:5'-nucleotidase C-terminal domain-containing protein [Yinghuangia aomiensis]